MSDYSLLPKREEWATGDEAVDNKLSMMLSKTLVDLNFESIKFFNEEALLVQLRIYNPSYKQLIDLITRALLFHLEPTAFNNEMMTKLKGNYFNRQKEIINIDSVSLIRDELKALGVSRYKGELDLYYREGLYNQRNPFLKETLINSPFELTTKILMKDFKGFLAGQECSRIKENELFLKLRDHELVLVIEGLGEFWFFEDQVFSLNLI